MINARGVVVDGDWTLPLSVSPSTPHPLAPFAGGLFWSAFWPPSRPPRGPRRESRLLLRLLSISPELVEQHLPGEPPRQSSSSGLRERAGAIKAELIG